MGVKLKDSHINLKVKTNLNCTWDVWGWEGMTWTLLHLGWQLEDFQDKGTEQGRGDRPGYTRSGSQARAVTSEHSQVWGRADGGSIGPTGPQATSESSRAAAVQGRAEGGSPGETEPTLRRREKELQDFELTCRSNSAARGRGRRQGGQEAATAHPRRGTWGQVGRAQRRWGRTVLLDSAGARRSRPNAR